MTKELATQNIDNLYNGGFMSQENFSAKIARINQIANDNSIHYKTKGNKYAALVAMAKNGF